MASGVRLLTNTGYYGAREGKFLPTLRQTGFTEEEIEKLTVTDPAKAFSIGVRKG